MAQSPAPALRNESRLRDRAVWCVLGTACHVTVPVDQRLPRLAALVTDAGGHGLGQCNHSPLFRAGFPTWVEAQLAHFSFTWVATTCGAFVVIRPELQALAKCVDQVEPPIAA